MNKRTRLGSKEEHENPPLMGVMTGHVVEVISDRRWDKGRLAEVVVPDFGQGYVVVNLYPDGGRLTLEPNEIELEYMMGRERESHFIVQRLMTLWGIKTPQALRRAERLKVQLAHVHRRELERMKSVYSTSLVIRKEVAA